MKPDITDYRLDRLREDLDIARDLLARLSAQVAEHDAVLARMCHGRPADLPEGASFALCIHGEGWSIQDSTSTISQKDRYMWITWRNHRPHEIIKSGGADSIPDAMDKIRKAHAELGVTP